MTKPRPPKPAPKRARPDDKPLGEYVPIEGSGGNSPPPPPPKKP